MWGAKILAQALVQGRHRCHEVTHTPTDEQCSLVSAPFGIKGFTFVPPWGLCHSNIWRVKQSKTQDRRAEMLLKSNVVQSFPFIFFMKMLSESSVPVSCFGFIHRHHLHPLCPIPHAQILAYLESSLPLRSQVSDCVTNCEHPLPLPVVFALNPVKHFLRSLIASLRLSICLNTLLYCVLLNLCQMKTDGLIYSDVLPLAFRIAVRAAILTKGVLRSKQGADLSTSRPLRWLQVSWEAVDFGIMLAFLIPPLPGNSTALSSRNVTLPSHPWSHLKEYKEYIQGTAITPHLLPRNSCSWVVHSEQGSYFCDIIQSLLEDVWNRSMLQFWWHFWRARGDTNCWRIIKAVPFY